MLTETRLGKIGLPSGPGQGEAELRFPAPAAVAGNFEKARNQARRSAGTSFAAAKLREARLDDYLQISELQTRNGLATRSYADWSALWTENPAHANRQIPIGWVLEGADGEIGGYLGNLALDYEFRGRLLRAATDYSWVVDPAYRRGSVELLCRFLKQPEVELFVCTTPNAIAEKILRAFDFSKANSGRWDQAGFWITGYRGFSATALRAAGIPYPSLLAYPLSAGLFVADAFRWPRPRAAEGEFECIPRFDARFDRFWEELKREQTGRLLANRSRAALEWHFQQPLAHGSAWLLAASRGTRLVAYAVFEQQDHPALGLKRIRVTDFQALKGFEELLSPALHWGLQTCRAEGAHVLENAGCWLDRFGVCGAAPQHRRRLQCWQFYYKTRDRELFRQLQDPSVWVPSSFDGDASL